MHPILDDRRRLALYLLGWLLVGLLLTVGLRSDSSWLTSAAFLLPLCLVFAFIGLSTWYLCRAFPIEPGANVSRLVVVLLTAAATASAIWTGLGYLWAAALDALIAGLDAQQFYAQERPLLFVVGALLYWLAAAGHYMLVAFQASRDAESRAFEQTLLAREAELRALRAQIDPHFIFNSLHSISALTADRRRRRRERCVCFSPTFCATRCASDRTAASRLRTSGRWPSAFWPSSRFGSDRVSTSSRETDPQAVECLVPPLLLQPLVENAVVHGIAQLVEGGTIRMTARRERFDR